jgi:CBS domain-containing protein
MTPRVLTVGPSAPLNDVIRLLRDRRVGRLFVVGAGLQLVGVVSQTDIIRAVVSE